MPSLRLLQTRGRSEFYPFKQVRLILRSGGGGVPHGDMGGDPSASGLEGRIETFWGGRERLPRGSSAGGTWLGKPVNQKTGRLLLYMVGMVLTFNLGRDITLITLYPFLFGFIMLVVWSRARGER